MPGGRPKGSKNKRKVVETPLGQRPLTITQRYICIQCGAEKAEIQFYVNKWAQQWTTSGRRVLVCKNCLGAIYKQWQERAGTEVAARVICHYLDIGFDEKQFNGATRGGDFNIGDYVKSQNLTQQQFLTYSDTIAHEYRDPSLNDRVANVGVPTSTSWSRQDRRNREYAISTIGYDPFAESKMSDADKKFCYNTLASYCDNDGVAEDGHKIQCIIRMTNSLLQCQKIDNLIDAETLQPNPNSNTIGSLSRTKRDLLASISTLSKDNNIASNYNDTSRPGKTTLSQKMKDMQDDDYWQAKQNLFDAKTSAAIKQIADLSNQSIFEQLSLDSNDYAQMVKDQREIILGNQRKIDELEEENRNLRNQISDTTRGKKRSGGAT